MTWLGWELAVAVARTRLGLVRRRLGGSPHSLGRVTGSLGSTAHSLGRLGGDSHNRLGQARGLGGGGMARGCLGRVRRSLGGGGGMA